MAKKKPGNAYTEKVQPYLDQIPEWYKTMTVRQIATKLGVGKTTFYKYVEQYPELAAALENGKTILVDDLKSALKRRALGYDYEETTTKETWSEKDGQKTETTTVCKHMPPDLGSIHLLLKNLDPDWHNDDAKTLELRERELKIKEQRAEAEAW